MISGSCYVEHCKEIGCLSRGCQHCRSAPFKSAYLRCHHVICGILQSCVEITICLQVKELSHMLTCCIFKSGALNNRNLSRFPVLRCVSRLYAFSFNTVISAHVYIFLSVLYVSYCFNSCNYFCILHYTPSCLPSGCS